MNIVKTASTLTLKTNIHDHDSSLRMLRLCECVISKTT